VAAIAPTAAKSYPAMPVVTLERVDGLHRLLPAQELEQRVERCGTLIWPQDVDRAAILYTGTAALEAASRREPCHGPQQTLTMGSGVGRLLALKPPWTTAR